MPEATAGTAPPPRLIAAAWLVALAAVGADACAQTGAVVSAEKSDEEIAKAALNPVAAMISLPFQYNYDEKIGPQETGRKNYLNVMPVVPFSIGQDWNLISRTIVPLVDVDLGTVGQSGIGDITQSLFFSPKQPTAGGWIWGAGRATGRTARTPARTAGAGAST